MGKLFPTSGYRQEKAMFRAGVLTFSIDRLRRSHNDFLDFQSLLDDQFIQKRRANRVYEHEPGKIGHVVLVSRLMRDYIHISQCRKQRTAVGDITVDELDFLGKTIRAP